MGNLPYFVLMDLLGWLGEKSRLFWLMKFFLSSKVLSRLSGLALKLFSSSNEMGIFISLK
jgi:hypothetical protein